MEFYVKPARFYCCEFSIFNLISFKLLKINVIKWEIDCRADAVMSTLLSISMTSADRWITRCGPIITRYVRSLGLEVNAFQFLHMIWYGLSMQYINKICIEWKASKESLESLLSIKCWEYCPGNYNVLCSFVCLSE